MFLKCVNIVRSVAAGREMQSSGFNRGGDVGNFYLLIQKLGDITFTPPFQTNCCLRNLTLAFLCFVNCYVDISYVLKFGTLECQKSLRSDSLKSVLRESAKYKLDLVGVQEFGPIDVLCSFHSENFRSYCLTYFDDAPLE